jgi:Rieske 2Fe-2S family protein
MTVRPQDLVAAYRPGFSLERAFYTDEAVFREELQRLWRRFWLFAGHSVEIRNPGDWMTWELGGDPLVITRDEAGQVHAFYNVCRHRGSLVCTQERGSSRRLFCPYHAWSYGLDGALLNAPGMPEDFDRSGHGLVRVHAGEFDGLIFVSLAESPPPFEALRDHLSPVLRSQGMATARIAAIKDYELDLNWKVVIENNRECYHCPSNHHGYVAVQYDTDADKPGMAAEIAERLAECTVRWERLGIDVSRVNTSSRSTAEWFRANRTPVRRGMVTESPDGQLVCRKLMGGFTDPDLGTARSNTNLNFWCHANSDYAHTVRITPVSPSRTVVRGYWLVDESAEEGEDYDPRAVVAFHDGVMEEDWAICRRVWKGVTSSAYRPGPYVPVQEANVQRWIDWYMAEMRR